MIEENPGASFQEIAKLIGEKWNALSPREKEKYEELMTKDVYRYSHTPLGTTSVINENVCCNQRFLQQWGLLTMMSHL